MAKHYIKASALAKMIPCVSTEETRAYLKGVYVDASGVLVATDGHVMGVQKLSPGIDCSLEFVPALAGRTIKIPKTQHLKSKGRLYAWVEIEDEIEDENGHLMVHQEMADNWESMNKRIKHPVPNITHVEPGSCFNYGTFPDWQRVVPRDCTEAGTGEAALSCIVLGKIRDFLTLDGRMGTAIKAWHSPPASTTSALIFRSCQNAFIVAMPIRGDKLIQGPALPDWIR